MTAVLQLPRRRFVVALAGLVAACTGGGAHERPEEAVRHFVEGIQRFDGKEQDAKELFGLLSERARTNLESRAERYSNASGKTIAPWAMLVPARVTPGFLPRAYVSKVVGKYALVEVIGVSPDQHAEIPCVLEEEQWRVDLALPDLAPLPTRPGK